jgi:hypothetical protein
VFDTAAGCKDKNDGKTGTSGGGDAMATMVKLKDKMCACKDAECARKVSDEMTAWSQQQGGTRDNKLSEADQKKATEVGTQMGECMQKALAASAEVAGEPPAPAGDGDAMDGSAAAGVPEECNEYKAAIERLATCEQINASARTTLLEAYRQASAGWATDSEAAKANLKSSCKAGTESVTAVAKQHCGW